MSELTAAEIAEGERKALARVGCASRAELEARVRSDDATEAERLLWFAMDGRCL